MDDFIRKCFVCQVDINPAVAEKNQELNLPVCSNCKGSEKEKVMVKTMREGLADGFVCGCI